MEQYRRNTGSSSCLHELAVAGQRKKGQRTWPDVVLCGLVPRAFGACRSRVRACHPGEINVSRVSSYLASGLARCVWSISEEPDQNQERPDSAGQDDGQISYRHAQSSDAQRDVSLSLCFQRRMPQQYAAPWSFQRVERYDLSPEPTYWARRVAPDCRWGVTRSGTLLKASSLYSREARTTKLDNE